MTLLEWKRTLSIGLVPIISTVALVGCGKIANSKPSSLIVTHAASRSADIFLIAGYNRHNLWSNFNGFANGTLNVTMPVGYRVTLHVTNDGGVPYDVGVYTKDQQLAFPGAGNSLSDYVQNPSAGIMPGSSATYTFTANRVGDYRLEDLLYQFPGHHPTDLALGMWGVFHVTQTGSPRATST